MTNSRVSIDDAKNMIYRSPVLFFDFDGTLVNLDTLNVESFKYVFRSMFEFDFTKEDFMKYVSGRSSENGIRKYLEINGITDYSGKDLNNMFNMYKDKLIDEEIDSKVYLTNGVEEFLKYYNFKRLIIVTSSRREYVERILGYFDILKYFEKIFDRLDTVRGKPNPLPYENAIKYANITGEGVGFEDSFYGLQSSKGAGLFTIGIQNTGWNDEFVYELADSVISDYRSLIS